MTAAVSRALAAIALLAVVAPREAGADRRNFAFSYEPVTLPQGQLELEQYLTATVLRAPGGGDHNPSWVYQIEAEYGVTNHLDLALYQMFGQGPGEPLAWQGYKARARWRPTNRGDWFIDPLVYLEWVQEADGACGFEEKLVLGRTFGRLIATLNVTFEQERLNRRAREYAISPSLGVGFQIRPWLTVGVEAVTKHEIERREVESMGFVGPTVSLAGHRVFVTVSALARVFGGAEAAAREDVVVRAILGIDL